MEDVFWMAKNYERCGWGRRRLLERHLEQEASTSSRKIGEVFATVGKRASGETLTLIDK